MGRLEGRTALVTGASRGIGYQAALAYAREGAHVIALARTVGALEELDDAIKEAGGAATLVPLDILDFEALDRLGAAIDERWGRLDILLANAGMLGAVSPLGHLEPKDFERTIAVNLTANWRLIRSLDLLLRASDAGRAIFMSSGAAHTNKPFWGGYAASKAALEVLAKTWANESASTSLKVNCVNPGAMRTAMRAKAVPGEDPQTVPHPSEIADLLVTLASPETTMNGGLYDFRKGDWV